MKKLILGLLLLFSVSLYSQSDVIQDSFILVVDYDTVNVVDDSTFIVFITAKPDQFGSGYLATGIDSGYIFIDGRGESYYVDSIGARSSIDGWFRIVENKTITGSPSGRGWVFKPLSSGLIPVPPSNASGVAPILVAKVIANNAIKAKTFYVDSSTTIVTTVNVGVADIDTIPIINGLNQSRLDTMHLVGITRTKSGWLPSTAARDTLYPDAFVFSLFGSDSMVIVYNGTIEFQDSVFKAGTNYYQPYDYLKYQETPDTILEQLVFKAVDTNKVEIRDRYSYLAENKSQSDRIIPYYDTIPASALISNSIIGMFDTDSLSGLSPGNTVSSWPDAIGSLGWNAVGSSPTYTLVNTGSYLGTVGGVNFFGHADRARTNNVLGAGKTEISYALVYRRNTNTSTDRWMFSANTADSGNRHGIRQNNSSDDTNLEYIRGGTSVDFTFAPQTGEDYIIVVRITQTEIKLWLAPLDDRTNFTTSFNTFSNNGFTFGDYRFFFSGNENNANPTNYILLDKFVFFDGALSDTDAEELIVNWKRINFYE